MRPDLHRSSASQRLEPSPQIHGDLTPARNAALQASAIQRTRSSRSRLKVHRQLAITRTRGIFPQLACIARENSDALSTARNSDILLLPIGRGFHR